MCAGNSRCFCVCVRAILLVASVCVHIQMILVASVRARVADSRSSLLASGGAGVILTASGGAHNR